MRDFVIQPIIDSPKRNHSNTYGRLLTSVNSVSVCLLLLSSTHGVKPGQLAALPGDCDITSDSGVWRVFSAVSQWCHEVSTRSISPAATGAICG